MQLCFAHERAATAGLSFIDAQHGFHLSFSAGGYMKQEDEPKGTIVILLVYIVILALSWGGIYLLMLQRGGG